MKGIMVCERKKRVKSVLFLFRAFSDLDFDYLSEISKPFVNTTAYLLPVVSRWGSLGSPQKDS